MTPGHPEESDRELPRSPRALARGIVAVLFGIGVFAATAWGWRAGTGADERSFQRLAALAGADGVVTETTVTSVRRRKWRTWQTIWTVRVGFRYAVSDGARVGSQAFETLDNAVAARYERLFPEGRNVAVWHDGVPAGEALVDLAFPSYEPGINFAVLFLRLFLGAPALFGGLVTLVAAAANKSLAPRSWPEFLRQAPIRLGGVAFAFVVASVAADFVVAPLAGWIPARATRVETDARVVGERDVIAVGEPRRWPVISLDAGGRAVEVRGIPVSPGATHRIGEVVRVVHPAGQPERAILPPPAPPTPYDLLVRSPGLLTGALVFFVALWLFAGWLRYRGA